ncbi:hypothetical protein CRUP_016322, partial [Coryphaenoides rupestris]
MRRAPNGTWMWNGEPSDYFEWHSDPPRNTDCGTFIADTEEWLGYPCDDHYGFVCYSDNLVLIKEEKTWEEALQHCRDLGEYDLLSSQYDHRFVRRHIEKAVTNEVWIGLRFLAGEWKWMDGDKMEQQGLPHCAPKGKHCGIRHKYSSTLEIRDCMEKRNFICYKFFNNLVLIKEEKTWEEALQHCRDLGEYDLLSLHYIHSYVSRHIGNAVTDE